MGGNAVQGHAARLEGVADFLRGLEELATVEVVVARLDAGCACGLGEFEHFGE
jgi:hypothetical protein